MTDKEAEKLIRVEGKLRGYARAIREYRIDEDPQNEMLFDLEHDILERADDLAQLSRPIKIKTH